VVDLSGEEYFRNYLEEYAEMGLTNTSNMRAFIPILELEELEHNKRWLAGNDISGCFDGASRLGEVEAFVARSRRGPTR
jgi:hypothetical protein